MTAGQRNAAGALVLIACGQYFVAEGIAAAAWRERPYSYLHNYISDLGMTTCGGSGPCSPLNAVMNAGFLLAGVLAITAALLLVPLWLRPGWRRALIALAILHGLGSMVVGVVHSAPGTLHGTPRLHILGAYAAIVGGNLGLVVAGIGLSRDATTLWFRRVGVTLGLIGFASGVALVLVRALPPGLAERGAVDTVTVWEVFAGVALMVTLRRQHQAAMA